jgi:hypothetical protein
MDDIFRVLDQVLKYKKNVKSWTIYQHYKKENAYLLQLSKEEVQEYRRIMWTTHTTLNDWFDSWEEFCLSHGFASKNELGEKILRKHRCAAL